MFPADVGVPAVPPAGGGVGAGLAPAVSKPTAQPGGGSPHQLGVVTHRSQVVVLLPVPELRPLRVPGPHGELPRHLVWRGDHWTFCPFQLCPTLWLAMKIFSPQVPNLAVQRAAAALCCSPLHSSAQSCACRAASRSHTCTTQFNIQHIGCGVLTMRCMSAAGGVTAARSLLCSRRTVRRSSALLRGWSRAAGSRDTRRAPTGTAHNFTGHSDFYYE